ncbi:hypothetical protein CLV63_115137 [Murinocardiopsis flavida]|uniref:Uncharacterized protein n=1 Tax=Murinocardiopsis flavida TaxID=645275 RepID=A0A2P8DE25_9ACTN|nr:hypothetical protein [Murinocardiopsis flavida]PSK95474.1 hypothetical protein CLV63_115137 [Murinocardiopsis flavida]
MARKVSDPSPGARSATARRRRLPARRGTHGTAVPPAAVPQQPAPHEPALAVPPSSAAASADPVRPILRWHLVTAPDGVTRPEALWS